MLQRLCLFARKLYLGIVCCDEKYSWQEPEANYAKWYDLFWLLIPIIGFLIFTEAIKDRGKVVYNRKTNN